VVGAAVVVVVAAVVVVGAGTMVVERSAPPPQAARSKAKAIPMAGLRIKGLPQWSDRAYRKGALGEKRSAATGNHLDREVAERVHVHPIPAGGTSGTAT